MALIENPPRSLRILLLLHIIIFGVLGIVGILSFLSDAVLKNAVTEKSLMVLIFSVFAALVAWVDIRLSSYNPYRNRKAMLGITMVAWVETALIGLSLPFLFYRIQAVPIYAWIIVIPSLYFAIISASFSNTLSRAHQGQDRIPPDSKEHSETPS